MAKVNRYHSTNDKNVVHNYKDGGLVETLLQHFQKPVQRPSHPYEGPDEGMVNYAPRQGDEYMSIHPDMGRQLRERTTKRRM